MALNNSIAQTSVDFQGLAELRRSATLDQNDQETLKQVAGQFESLFLNMMLKSMRQASLSDGIFDSSQSKMYQDMSDQQLAMDLSQRGGLGLQDVIIRQLGGQVGSETSPINQTGFYSIDTVEVRAQLVQTIKDKATEIADKNAVSSIDPQDDTLTDVSPNDALFDIKNVTFSTPEQFIETLWPMAQQAADKLGVTPEVILSQAALETGWGKHVINHHDGDSSHNLFNIKADSRWSGDHATVGTLEYRNGVAMKESAQFRSYDSYQQSFDDYVNFIQTQPRYQQALQHTAQPEKFVEELHKAGYATDPNYANKIKRIMNSDTLAQISQRSVNY